MYVVHVRRRHPLLPVATRCTPLPPIVSRYTPSSPIVTRYLSLSPVETRRHPLLPVVTRYLLDMICYPNFNGRLGAIHISDVRPCFYMFAKVNVNHSNKNTYFGWILDSKHE